MKKLRSLLSAALVLALLLTALPLGTSAASFEDYADGEEVAYQAAVDILRAINVTDEGNNFRPTKEFSREDAAKMLAYMLLGRGYGDIGAPFTDVGGGSWWDGHSSWAAGYVSYCQSAGIIGGVYSINAQQTFTPNGSQLNGYAYLAMLLRSLGYDSSTQEFTGEEVPWGFNVIGYPIQQGAKSTYYTGRMYLPQELFQAAGAANAFVTVNNGLAAVNFPAATAAAMGQSGAGGWVVEMKAGKSGGASSLPLGSYQENDTSVSMSVTPVAASAMPKGKTMQGWSRVLTKTGSLEQMEMPSTTELYAQVRLSARGTSAAAVITDAATGAVNPTSTTAATAGGVVAGVTFQPGQTVTLAVQNLDQGSNKDENGGSMVPIRYIANACGIADDQMDWDAPATGADVGEYARMLGMDAGSVTDPGADMTRAMIWEILARMDVPQSAASQGMTQEDWALYVIASAMATNPELGWSGAEDPLTREQLLTLLWTMNGVTTDFTMTNFQAGGDAAKAAIPASAYKKAPVEAAPQYKEGFYQLVDGVYVWVDDPYGGNGAGSDMFYYEPGKGFVPAG